MTKSRLFSAFACVALCALAAVAAPRTPSVAVLDFGETRTGLRAGDELAAQFRAHSPSLSAANRSQSRAAARGAGYEGSLNLSLEEARDLGASVGCDFFVTGAADTVRREASGRPLYFESFASVFVVSSFTGKLVRWEHLSVEAPTEEAAARGLLAKLREASNGIASAITKAAEGERAEHRVRIERDTPVIEEAPGDDAPAAKTFRQPLPFRRLRPAYTDEASRANVVAVIDALVELDERGEVRSVEIARWGGYGLDESVAATIRQMHFRPALREGKAVPVRVLLRYNFRRPKN